MNTKKKKAAATLGIAAAAATLSLAGCGPTPGHPAAAPAATKPSPPAPTPAPPTPAPPLSGLAQIGGPDTRIGPDADIDMPRPDDPHQLIGSNWPGDAAAIFLWVHYHAADGELVGEHVGETSRATAGEVANDVLALNGGRPAAAVGITPAVLNGRGMQVTQVGIVYANAADQVKDCEKLIAGDVMQGNREIELERKYGDAVVSSTIRDARDRIAGRYTALVAALRDLGPQLAAHGLPARSAAGANVYVGVSPSGHAYGVDANGRPLTRLGPVPADAPTVYPLPPLRPTPPAPSQ